MVSNSSSFSFDLKTHATDYLPDALAADTLRGLIHQQDEQLSCLDDEIAQLRVRLHVLEEQRAELAKFRDLHRAFLAPIRKLAPEILGEVFIQCVLDAWNGPFENGWHAHGWPAFPSVVRLSLRRVCQRWERIAIGTPGVWTVLRFDATQWQPYDHVQMCLDNSGCLPIQVRLDYCNYIGSVEIRPLLDNFHRVQEIKGYIFPLMEEILRQRLILPTPLLNVAHLVAEGPPRFSEEERFRLQDIIQAPPIESLHLKGCASLFPVFCRKPDKLQHLKVDLDRHLYIPALLDILPFSSSLRSLDLQLPTEMVAIGEDVPMIILPHLRSLRVKGRRSHICELLAVLDVPSLDCLTLVCFGGPEGTPWIPIQSFLQGDPPPLRSLTLEHVSLEHGFVDFISRLFHLEYLRLDMCHITAEHLEVFILDSHVPHDNIVCPRLATLSLDETTLPGDILVQVVQSRAPLSGIPWEHRCLRTVEARCLDLGDHGVALEDIREACGGCLALYLCPCCSWNDDDE